MAMATCWSVNRHPMKPSHILHLCLVTVILTGCSTAGREFSYPNASGKTVAKAEQCVPYARRMSGVELYGDAYSWWDKAQKTGYTRGPSPKPGAVLVLARTSKMTSGHVAVVNRVLDARHIDVTHSNWGNDKKSRRVIYKSMLVEDISSGNDWSSVRFWNREENCFGFPYAVSGFIYQ